MCLHINFFKNIYGSFDALCIKAIRTTDRSAVKLPGGFLSLARWRSLDNVPAVSLMYYPVGAQVHEREGGGCKVGSVILTE